MKILLGIVAILCTMISCQKEESLTEIENESISSKVQMGCATSEILKQQLKDNPKLAQDLLKIEEFTNKQINLKSAKLASIGQIVIPVVVNVLYQNQLENISMERIQAEINGLNEDFNAQNTDLWKVPQAFKSVTANVGIKFVLDQVQRKQSDVKWSSSSPNDMKYDSFGGISAISTKTKLNIWICKFNGPENAYALYPTFAGSFNDGIVIQPYAFGTRLFSNATRTLTHEVGHWMNLKHLWGDDDNVKCGDDFVADTPPTERQYVGFSLLPRYTNCGGRRQLQMNMNFMDYAGPYGQYMFSNGQKARMLAIFAPGGSRPGFVQ